MIRECLKALWYDHKYIISFMGLFLFGAAILAWLYYDYILTQNRRWLSYEARISLVSLWVGIIGFALAVIAAVLAILQFQAALRKPDLHLWIGAIGQKELTLAGQGSGEFALILENRGKGVARHVKVTIVFLMPANVPSIHALRSRVEPHRSIYQDHWRRIEHLGDHILANFVGKDGYVCYDEDWDELGLFHINWRPDENLDPQYPVKYKLRCEGMKQREGFLTIKFPPPNEAGLLLG